MTNFHRSLNRGGGLESLLLLRPLDGAFRRRPQPCAPPDYDSPALMDQIRLLVRDAVRDVIQEGSAAATVVAVVSSAPPSASSAGAPAAVPAVSCAAPQADVQISVTSIGPHAGIDPVGSDGTVPNVPLAAVLTPAAGDFSVSVSAGIRQRIIEHKFVNLSQLLFRL